MSYVCRVKVCPECDPEGHRCKCYDLDDQYERYPDGCPCGNNPQWEEQEGDFQDDL